MSLLGSDGVAFEHGYVDSVKAVESMSGALKYRLGCMADEVQYAEDKEFKGVAQPCVDAPVSQLLSTMWGQTGASPGFIYLVGQPEGWAGPSPGNAAHYADWRLFEPDNAIGSKVYTGVFEIPAGQAMFRFYTELTGWDADSYGTQVDDRPIEYEMVDGSFAGTLVKGKGPFSFPFWEGGEMTITVDMSDAKNMIVTMQEGSHSATVTKYIYLVGNISGWMAPHTENAEAYNDYRLVDKNDSGLYTGSWHVEAGHVNFRFALELTDAGWDNDQQIGIAADEVDVACSFSNGQFCGPYVPGKGNWAFDLDKAGTLTFTVDTNYKIVNYTFTADGSDSLGSNVDDGVFVYTISSEGTAVLSGTVSGSPVSGDVVMPDFIEYDGEKIPVVSISRPLKELVDVATVKSLVIHTPINTVAAHSLVDCHQLVRLELPKGLKSVQEYAFARCSSLKELVLPEGLETIEGHSFYSCEKLEDLRLPNGLKSIGPGAFGICKELKNINFPEGLETIEQYAFYDCFKLERLQLPLSLKSIGRQAFEECYKLKELYLPDGLKKIGSGAFNFCMELETISLPAGLKIVEAQAFNGCYSLMELYISESVETICRRAFGSCNLLESLVLPSSLKTLEEYSFADCYSLKNLTLPEGLVSIGAGSFCGCNSLEEFIIPSSVNSIDDYAFYNFAEIMRKVTCNGVEPADVSENAFTVHCYENASLYVPQESLSKYRSHPVWQKFGQIQTEEPPAVKLVEAVVIDPSYVSLEVGDKFAITGYAIPADADNTKLNWYSEDDDIATIREGVVEAMGKGKTYIVAISTDGSDVSDRCEVDVTEPDGVASAGADGVRLSVDGRTVHIDNLPKNETACVFQTDGKMIYRERSVGRHLSFGPVSAGVYIVVYGSKRIKIELR